MIDEATIKAVERHGLSHQIGYCSCPCYDALIKVGEALPARDAGARLEGFLTAHGALDVDDSEAAAEPGAGL